MEWKELKTIKLQMPWTVKAIAEALGEPIDDVINKLIDMGAPATVTKNTTLDTDLAKFLALKYCCYLEN